MRRLQVAAIQFVVEVDGFDDQRVALPMTPRIAEPLADALRSVRPAVEWDDARFVDHLHLNHDVVRGLMNLVEVVVEIGNHRDRQRSRDAALPRISVQPRISLSSSPPCVLPRHEPLNGLGFHRWDSSVGRVNHESRTCEWPAGIVEGGARSVRSLAYKA